MAVATGSRDCRGVHWTWKLPTDGSVTIIAWGYQNPASLEARGTPSWPEPEPKLRLLEAHVPWEPRMRARAHTRDLEDYFQETLVMLQGRLVHVATRMAMAAGCVTPDGTPWEIHLIEDDAAWHAAVEAWRAELQ